jgi:uncharacterized membrane protein
VSEHKIRRALFRAPNWPGVVVGLVFWWCSLIPSMMPRTWAVQAAISAICTAIGYALGTLGRAVVRAVRRRRPSAGGSSSASGPQLARWATMVAVVGLGAVGSWFWVRWQDQQRELVSLDPVAPASVLPMLVVTVVLTVVLGLVGRLVGGGVRRLDRWNRRHLPGPLALPTTIILVLLVSGYLVRDVAFDAFTSWADRTFSLVDEGTNEGTEQPTVATASGSPDSLVDWDDLGVQGRDFVAQSTTEADLQAFAEASGGDPRDVVAPVRAYAGLRSADEVDERAELAVADLERAGGFDREILVVATSTGTGWIDPDAARAIELMHGGDTAIVSMQYSFLPSWISFITDLDRASEAGAALFHATYEAWKELPEDDRPRLIAFGLSLGAYGAGGAFAGASADVSVANITTRSDGALFVGTPYATPILRQLVDERQPGSVAWAPIVDDGEVVRFETRDPDQPRPEGPWPEPRVAFVQHPSDPVTHWYYNWWWRKPAWMDQPRGYDVPQKSTWIPIVTGTQGVFDLMAGFSAPPGFGHDYRLDYPAAWASVAPPEGWSDEDTAALEAFTQAEREAAATEGG